MSLHFLQKRCDECGSIYCMRRPNRTTLIPRIVALTKCPVCHPEALEGVCGACLLPFGVVKCHSNGLCNPCAVREMRYKAKPPVSIQTICLPTRSEKR